MSTDLGSILVTGALITVGSFTFVCLAFAIGALIGRALARLSESREERFSRVVAETPDEVFIDAIRRYERQ